MSSAPDDPFVHGGRAGEILRHIDWSAKPIGPVSGWPQSLRTALSICLSSRYPICIIWGPDRLYLYNDAYSPILGAKHPWALGESYITVWPEIWDSSIRPILEAVEQTGEASWCDNLLLVLQRRGFNEECYFSFSFAPTRIEDGSVGGVFTAITETTPQVVGERRLRMLRDLAAQSTRARTPTEACTLATEVFAANAHDAAFALFYLANAEGKTARLVQQTGLAASSAAARPHLSFEDDDAAWPLAEASRTGQPVIVSGLQERFGLLPGGPWPENTHTAVVLPIARAGQSAPYGYLVAGISPRRALDEDYLSFLKLAATHVASAMANAEAYAEEKRRSEALAEIDRAKTAFFSNVSHEFRTPLTLMLGPLADLLNRRDAVPESVRPQLELTYRNSQRLLKLVNSLLDFSRLEAGRLQANYEPVDLGSFTAELAAVFRSTIEKAGLRYRVDCQPTQVPAYVDRDLWEKIVFNLLSNAFKFTMAGEIALTLSESVHQLELTVRDTGVGIPASELPNVFKRFHRIENPRSRTHEGTGIGLALAQELAKLHGGSIRVASEFGVGTTFTVTLPTGKAHLPAAQVNSTPALASHRATTQAYADEAQRWVAGEDCPSMSTDRAANAAATPGTPRARILVADDNADMRLYLGRLLEGLYVVELVADGEAALAAIGCRRPDVILTDIMMPRLDGVGLLREVRANPGTRTLPVILLSARAGQEANVVGYEAGADDYLVKPFSPAELLVKVKTHLRLSELRAESARQLEAERRRLHELLMRAPAIVCVLRGPNHVFDLVNPHYLELVGRASPDELLGKPVREALPEVVGQGYVDILDRVYRTGEPFIGRERLVKLLRAGRTTLEDCYVNFVYQPTHGADGVIDGILAHAVDVTEQVRDRQAVEQLARRLAAERRLYHTILSSTPDLVYVFDLNHRFTYANQALLRMWGRSWEEAVGRNCLELGYEPWHAEMHDREIEQVIKTRKPIRGEVPFAGANGRRMYDYIFVPVLGAQGEVEAIAGTTRDVTDMAAARETVAHRGTELERLVQERTAQLKETIEQMEEFSYSVSHDLRAPTRAMCGYAEALLEDHGAGMNDEARQLLERIRRNGLRMDRMIRDLLTYSRISRTDLRLERILLDRLLPELLGQYPELHPDRADIHVPDLLPAVLAHEPSLVQVLSNLLSNAVKFVAPGTRPRVVLTADAHAGRVRLWIADNGIGIPPENRRRLFGMFERMHPTLSYEGTGIGLAIVRKAVERMHGSVGVESDGVTGSRFWIELAAG